jgi:glucosylceramidase
MPIHSCDFSVDVYTFADTPGDTSLDHFDDEVTYDQTLSLPLIKDALAATPDLKLFGSPWSPRTCAALGERSERRNGATTSLLLRKRSEPAAPFVPRAERVEGACPQPSPFARAERA